MERTPTFQVQGFGNYYLLERIAVGGMAEIFKAKQTGARGFEKIVVIKRILQHLSEDPEFVEMFEDEAKLAAQLTHGNIVQIYELGEVDQTLYITMEMVEGRNLRDLTRAISGKGLHLSIEQCVLIISEALKGLDYAHRKVDSKGVPLHIIHRDISPQNIIISYEGEVKILDFGIAKAASKISKTEAGVLKGKFSYMSPEQASGKPIDQSSDLYAVGVILHELLTSERLFRSKTDMETLEKVKEGRVSPPSEFNPDISPALDRIVMKALAKNISDRYASASDFLTDLVRFAFESQFTYSSQELSVFMKTIFAETIRDEKSRLLESLARVVETPMRQIQNARTHIAFKRSPSESVPKTELQLQNSGSPDVTGTFEGRGKIVESRTLWLSSLLIVFVAIGIFIFGNRSSAPIKDGSDVSTQEAIEIVEIPKITPPNTKPLEDNLGAINRNNQSTVPSPPPTELTAPLDRPPSKFDELPARPITGGKPKATKKVSPPAPTLTAPRAAQSSFAKLNVTAPLDGFANLYIDDALIGTVPGPKARNIKVSAGVHSIRCETSSKTYSGQFEIKADQTLTIRCQELNP